jgi:antibiotic biosynthesis monooxygenase (ABM) superfamily enzyme
MTDMKRVSIRTLALLVELLIAVIVHQYVSVPAPPRADAVWLAGDSTTVPPAPLCRAHDTNCL